MSNKLEVTTNIQSITLFANEESRDKVQWTLPLNNMADL